VKQNDRSLAYRKERSRFPTFPVRRKIAVTDMEVTRCPPVVNLWAATGRRWGDYGFQTAKLGGIVYPPRLRDFPGEGVELNIMRRHCAPCPLPATVPRERRKGQALHEARAKSTRFRIEPTRPRFSLQKANQFGVEFPSSKIFALRRLKPE